MGNFAFKCPKSRLLLHYFLAGTSVFDRRCRIDGKLFKSADYLLILRYPSFFSQSHLIGPTQFVKIGGGYLDMTSLDVMHAGSWVFLFSVVSLFHLYKKEEPQFLAPRVVWKSKRLVSFPLIVKMTADSRV